MRQLRAIIAASAIVMLCATAMATTFSSLTSMETQVAKAANTPYAVAMTGDSSKAFKIDGTKLTVAHSGSYYFNAAAQIGGNAAGNVFLWLRLNGKDVPESNSVQNIPSPGFTTVLVSQGGLTLKAGDVLEFMYGASAPGLGLVASKPANMPAVPSIIFAIFEL